MSFIHIHKRFLWIAFAAVFSALLWSAYTFVNRDNSLYQASLFINAGDVGCKQEADSIHCNEIPSSITGACNLISDSHIIRLEDDYLSGVCHLHFERSSLPSNWTPDGDVCTENDSKVECRVSLYKDLNFQGTNDHLITRFVVDEKDVQLEERKISDIQGIGNNQNNALVIEFTDAKYVYNNGYFIKDNNAQRVQAPNLGQCNNLEGKDLYNSPSCLKDSANVFSIKNASFYSLIHKSDINNKLYAYKAKESSEGRDLDRWSPQFLNVESLSDSSINPKFQLKYPASAVISLNDTIFPQTFAEEINSPPVFDLQFAHIDTTNGSMKQSAIIKAQLYNIIEAVDSDYTVVAQLDKTKWDTVMSDIGPNVWRVLHHEYDGSSNKKQSGWSSLGELKMSIDSNFQIISPKQDVSLLKDFGSFHTQVGSENTSEMDIGAVIKNTVGSFTSTDTLKGAFLFGNKEMYLTQNDIFYTLDVFQAIGATLVDPACKNIIFDVQDSNDIALTNFKVFRGFEGTFALSSFNAENSFKEVEWKLTGGQATEEELVQMNKMSLEKQSFILADEIDPKIKRLLVSSDIKLKNDVSCSLTKSLFLEEGLRIGLEKIHIFVEP
jgi:hypothetical protein